MGVINWDQYRKADGSLNLVLAFEADDHTHEDLTDAQKEEGIEFLVAVGRCQPIVSRQVAAVALTTAFFFAYLTEE